MHICKRVKKANYRRCRTDKTPFTSRCPKCYLSNNHRSRTFKTPENLWRHLHQIHDFDRNEYPSIPLVIDVLDEISSALSQSIPLDTITLAVKWRMIIQ
ncbi:hypothetical protein [Candidatus Nitrosopumilus sediminis]|uniref:hypothetical protein n=1 Tax=Candidatus Nitrosopumilus sediminis TaxID=1229909 RepID=UPI0012E9E6E6|nr:hypothetical protein [Candidatus Nitrosopumilus sediminis]